MAVPGADLLPDLSFSPWPFQYMPRFLLIVGFPRSGTTLLRELLGGHPQMLAYPTEPRFLRDVLASSSPAARALPEALKAHGLPAAPLGARDLPGTPAIEAWFTAWQRHERPDEPAWLLVKLPGLAGHLDEASTWFADVQVLHIVRDPRGAVASHQTRWPEGRLWPRVRDWQASVHAARDWGRRYPQRYYEVCFEALLAAPESVIRSMLGRLGLPYANDMLHLEYTLLQWSPAADTPQPRRFSGIDADKATQWQHQLTPAEATLIGYCCRTELAGLRQDGREVGAPILPPPPRLTLGARLLYLKERVMDRAAQLRTQ